MNYQVNHSTGKRLRNTLSCVLLSLSIYSCQSPEADANANGSKGAAADTASNTAKLAVTPQKLYDSLKNPWGMAWLPDGRLLVTERAGEILVLKMTSLPAKS